MLVYFVNIKGNNDNSNCELKEYNNFRAFAEFEDKVQCCIAEKKYDRYGGGV